MAPDDEINELDRQITWLMEKHPRKPGILRIGDAAFRACTRDIWNRHGWDPSSYEVKAIVRGDDSTRRKALLSLLADHCIREIQFVADVDIVEVKLCVQVDGCVSS